MRELTGFRIEPVPGLVPTRTFYGALADRCFLSTQYVRHHSVPFYTPEPDIVHEIIGHANGLASPVLADLYESAGRASLRAGSDDALELFSRIFWFTLEFGVVWEDGRAADLRRRPAVVVRGDRRVPPKPRSCPWPTSGGPWAAMGRQHYDITAYQPVLFAADSFERVVTDLTRFFDTFDETTYSVARRRGAPMTRHPPATRSGHLACTDGTASSSGSATPGPRRGS